jgi:glycosyltransferase A (GT-A) superfamily protein (DUF2064 family)
LRLAVEDVFSMGYERVVVIGNDAPDISRSYLLEAFRQLEDGGGRAAVLGPARDGGYALIGLSRPCPRAFDSMPWGSDRVCRLTENRLRGAGFRVERLPTLEDIDGPRNLARFLARAARGALTHLARELAVVLATLQPNIAPTVSRHLEMVSSGWLALRAPPDRP